jgi:hypothetical protein
VLTNFKNLIALHLPWCLTFVFATVGAGVWYWYESASRPRWPGGGSLIGLVFGALAGAIILFEMALWFRKTSWLRTYRCLGSAQLWMKAHIWLGLLTVPLVMMHSGFSFGGQFSAVLTWTFVVVIASGVLGLTMQNVLPRLMLEHLTNETVYSQIEVVARQYVADAARIVALTCGEAERGELVPETLESAHVVGAPRRVGTILTRTTKANEDYPRVMTADALRRAFTQDIRPFMASSRWRKGPLASRRKSRDYFAVLRNFVGEEASPAIVAVEQLCDKRRDLHTQRRIHHLLHGWLAVHLPLSCVLILLLIFHVYYALHFG